MKNGNSLTSKRCELWPDCCCHSTLVHFQNKLGNVRLRWEFEELKFAETSIFLALRCVANFCPVHRVKSWAQDQLLNPYWSRQHLGLEMTPEWFEQRRAHQ
jgi:hypothetical protein